MRQRALGNCRDGISPGFATIRGDIHRDRSPWIAAGIVVVEDLAVEEGVRVGAIQAGIAAQEVSGVRSRRHGAYVGERHATIGGVGGSTKRLAAGTGKEERSFKYAAGIV